MAKLLLGQATPYFLRRELIEASRQAGMDDHDVRRVASQSHLANTVFKAYTDRGGNINMAKLLLEQIIQRELGHQILDITIRISSGEDLLRLTPSELLKKIKEDPIYMELEKKAAEQTDPHKKMIALAKRKSFLDTKRRATNKAKRQQIFSRLESEYEIDEHGQRQKPDWSRNDTHSNPSTSATSTSTPTTPSSSSPRSLNDKRFLFIKSLINKSQELPSGLRCPDCTSTFAGKYELIKHMYNSKIPRHWPDSKKGSRSGAHSNERTWLAEHGEMIAGSSL